MNFAESILYLILHNVILFFILCESVYVKILEKTFTSSYIIALFCDKMISAENIYLILNKHLVF